MGSITKHSRPRGFMAKVVVAALVLSMLPAAAFAGDLAPARLASGADAQNSVPANPYEGTPYAVLTDDGELIFFRTANNGPGNGSDKTATDLAGNTYTGRMFRIYEDTANITQYYQVPWNSTRASIKSVRFAEGQKIRPRSCRWWFSSLTNVKSIDLSGLDTSLVTDMRAMFSYPGPGLTSLDVSHFDTSNVTNMCWMFTNATGLDRLDLSGFDTTKVTDMSYMFTNCENLTTLDVSHFDTSNVVSMRNMFADLDSLTALDLSSFDTSRTESMAYMFYGSYLTSIDLSGFDTSSVTDMSWMFYGCPSFTSLDLAGFDTSHVTTFERMFDSCTHLTELDLSSFDTSSAQMMDYMFNGCRRLSTVKLGRGFSFAGDGTVSPTSNVCLVTPPKTDGIHNGKWTTPKPGSLPQYTPAELRDAYEGETMAGTYVWAVSSLEVSFDANGGEGNMASATVAPGESYVVPSCGFSCAGSVFGGWNTKPDGTGAAFTAGSEIELVEPLTLYAQWVEPRIVLDVFDTLALEVQADGALEGPASGTVAFANRGNVDVRVSGLRVVPETGVVLTPDPEEVGEFEVSMAPAGGAPLDLSDCASQDFTEPAHPGDWVIACGRALYLSDVSGATGGVGFDCAESPVRIATMEWRFSVA